ncbi:hypothetical protein ACN4GJ_31985, partial [Burkholderia pseudomallei]
MSEIKEMPLIELTAKDLPAYCPNPAMPRWSAHPRVFIDVSHGAPFRYAAISSTRTAPLAPQFTR